MCFDARDLPSEESLTWKGACISINNNELHRVNASIACTKCTLKLATPYRNYRSAIIFHVVGEGRGHSVLVCAMRLRRYCRVTGIIWFIFRKVFHHIAWLPVPICFVCVVVDQVRGCLPREPWYVACCARHAYLQYLILQQPSTGADFTAAIVLWRRPLVR